MPEVNDAEYRSFVRYQNIGTPDEVEKKIADLVKDNGKQRDEIRDLKEKVPKDGTVVVDKAKADALTEYEALGKPAELKAKVEKVSTLETEIATQKREVAREAAAKTLGIEGKDLAPFAGSDALTYEVRETDVTENGKTEKRPVAFVKDSEGKELTLAEFGKEKWGRPFEAVLGSTKGADTTGTTRYTTQTATTQKRGEKVTDEQVRNATASTANYQL